MKLRTRISAAAIATAAAAGTTGAFLLPAASASAHSATHTLTFTATQQATAQLSPTVGASEDQDTSRAGKVIGFDTLRFSFNPQTNTTSIGAAIDLNGGFLYGQLRESDGPVTRGVVTGGTGIYRGATGTITAKTLDNDGTKTAVSITYRT